MKTKDINIKRLLFISLKAYVKRTCSYYKRWLLTWFSERKNPVIEMLKMAGGRAAA